MSAILLKVPISLAAAYNFISVTGPPQRIPSTEERARYKGLPLAVRLLQGKLFRIMMPMSQSLVAAMAAADAFFALAYAYRSTPLGERILRSVSNQSARPVISPAFVLGAIVTMWAAYMRKQCYRELGKLFTYELSIRDDHRLVTTGPYAVVRHPSYTALALQYIGITLCGMAKGTWLTEARILQGPLGKVVAGYWAFVLFVIAIVIARAPTEETMLRKEFKDEWDAYVKRVPYMFVPGVL